MLKFPKIFFVLPLLASVTLAGCWGEYNHRLVPAGLSSYAASYEKRAEDMQKAIATTNISFDLSRFVDRRIPAAYSTFEPNVVLHTYDPDRLPGNAPGFIRSVMAEALITNDTTTPDVREVFFELRHMDMRLLNGNFISGEFGRYYVNIEADVMVRDGQGNILVKKPYDIKYETARQSHSGRHLTTDEDWHYMTRTLKVTIHNMAFEIMNDTLKATGDVVHGGTIKPRPQHETPAVFTP